MPRQHRTRTNLGVATALTYRRRCGTHAAFLCGNKEFSYGSGAAATYDLTAAGKALLDDADASAQRTISAYIGCDVQAYDTELAALAGLTSAAEGISLLVLAPQLRTI